MWPQLLVQVQPIRVNEPPFWDSEMWREQALFPWIRRCENVRLKLLGTQKGASEWGITEKIEGKERFWLRPLNCRSRHKSYHAIHTHTYTHTHTLPFSLFLVFCLIWFGLCFLVPAVKRVLPDTHIDSQSRWPTPCLPVRTLPSVRVPESILVKPHQLALTLLSQIKPPPF